MQFFILDYEILLGKVHKFLRSRGFWLISIFMLFTSFSFFTETEAPEAPEFETCGTVTDIDGNVYETVMVAGECWIRSNLRVKHYRNGDPIPEIQDQNEWINTKEGAWCYYNNDPANEEKYGLLYNFNAVLDPRGLGPEGWQVPSICEFHNVMTYYGYYNSGDKVRDPNYWQPAGNYNPDNESGLSVLPGGFRTDQLGVGAEFQAINWAFAFWTTTTGNAYGNFDMPNIATSTVAAPFFNLHATFFHPRFGVNIRLSKIKETIDPKTIEPIEIYDCELKSLRNFLFALDDDYLYEFPELVGRLVCVNTTLVWLDPFLCFELQNTKVFKEDPFGDPMDLDEKFESDLTYYFLIGNQVGGSTCNEEYIPFTFKKTVLPAPEGESEQVFCNAGTISDLVVTGEELVWFETATSEVELTSDLPLENGKKYYVAQKTTGCESGERLEITAIIRQPSEPTGTSIQEFCQHATVQDLQVEGDNIKWYDVTGTELNPSFSLTDGNVYRAVSVEGSCESVAFEVRVEIKSPPAPVADQNQSFCQGALVSDIVLNASLPIFYSSETESTPIDPDEVLSDGIEIYVSQVVDGCESIERTKITISLKEVPEVQTYSFQEFCVSAFASELSAIGQDLKWYKDSSLEEILSFDSILEDQVSYYVTQSIDGCESLPVQVSVIIKSPEKPNSDPVQEFCGSAKIADLKVTGLGVRWYNSVDGKQELDLGTALIDGQKYFASQTIGGCESSMRAEVTVRIYQPELPEAQSEQSVCEGELLSDLIVTGNELKWYESLTGGSTIAENTVLEDGKSYFVSQTIGGCESDRQTVTVKIIPSLIPIGETQQEFCESSEPKIKDLFAVGEQVVWYDSPQGGSSLMDDVLLETGKVYYAANVNGIGCESQERLAVEVSVNICDVEVFNLVTLDGNTKNEYFKIKNIEFFPDNSLQIFNRYGVLVYSAKGYGLGENLFFGYQNVSGSGFDSNGLPSGNYLYILTFKVPLTGKEERLTGYLHLINSN